MFTFEMNNEWLEVTKGSFVYLESNDPTTAILIKNDSHRYCVINNEKVNNSHVTGICHSSENIKKGYPAFISFLNKTIFVVWRNDDDIRHRINGPAVFSIWENPMDGKIVDEKWYNNGELHRVDGGPARVTIPYKYFEMGTTNRCLYQNEWWINGINITSDVTKWFKMMNIIHYLDMTTDDKIAFKLQFS